MSYGEALGRSMEVGKKPKNPVLDHLRVMKAENGHLVEHHYDGYGSPDAEQHVFADGEGKAMLQHIAKHMGIKFEMKSEVEEPDHASNEA